MAEITVVQSQNLVSIQFSCKQIPRFGFADQRIQPHSFVSSGIAFHRITSSGVFFTSLGMALYRTNP